MRRLRLSLSLSLFHIVPYFMESSDTSFTARRSPTLRYLESRISGGVLRAFGQLKHQRYIAVSREGKLFARMMLREILSAQPSRDAGSVLARVLPFVQRKYRARSPEMERKESPRLIRDVIVGQSRTAKSKFMDELRYTRANPR